MENRWIVTPSFFESPEPDLCLIAPKGAVVNRPDISGRTFPELARRHAPIRVFVRETLQQGARPVSLVGDCCGAIPVLAGLQGEGIAPTLVWFDAHGDFNTPQTSPSGFLGGMPLAMISGRGWQDLCAADGLKPLADQDIVLVGARDLDPLETELLAASGVRQVTLAELPDIDGPVHLHFDTDLVTAAECAAFNYPVAGGPSAAEIKAVFGRMAVQADVRAVSVSGWTGARDTDGSAARLFADVLAVFGADYQA